MEIHKIIQQAEVRRFGSNSDYRVFSKAELLKTFGEMSEDDLNEFCREVLKLQHHKDTTEGLYATDKEPFNLLHEFWQRSSDACPVDATEAEKQENEFHDFAMERFFQIEY